MVPKVSVVIPVYNVEKYVEQAILSILNQSLKEIEIIVVNDGSKDNSLNIVKVLAQTDERIHLISTPNNGLSIARNIGFYHAKGKYVYFFDSDDILEENALEECYEKSDSLNLDFLFFDAICFNDNNLKNNFQYNYIRTYKYKEGIYSGIDILKEQLKTDGYRSSACLSFIKREFLINTNLYFYPRILHEDELFTFLLYLKAQKVGFINKSYFHRRVRNNSIMTNVYSMKNVNGYMTVVQELYNYFKFNAKVIEKDTLLNQINLIINCMYSSSIKKFNDKDVFQIKYYVISKLFAHLNFKMKIKILLPISLLRYYYK